MSLNPKQLAAARQQFVQAAHVIAQNPAAFQALPVVMRKTLVRQARKLEAPDTATLLQTLSDQPQYDANGYVIADGNQKLLFDYLLANAHRPHVKPQPAPHVSWWARLNHRIDLFTPVIRARSRRYA